jgi:hypothetical protein
MFKLIGVEASGQRILDLETKIASHHWDSVKDRDATLSYNKFSRAGLETLMPGFDWALYLRAGEVPEKAFETVIVMEPSFFTGLAGLLQSEPLEDWKLWLKWEIVSGTGAYANLRGNGSALMPEYNDGYAWEKLIELDVNKQMSQFVMQLDEHGQVLSYSKDQKSEDIRRTLAEQ